MELPSTWNWSSRSEHGHGSDDSGSHVWCMHCPWSGLDCGIIGRSWWWFHRHGTSIDMELQAWKGSDDSESKMPCRNFPWSGTDCMLKLNPFVRIWRDIRDWNQWWSRRYGKVIIRMTWHMLKVVTMLKGLSVTSLTSANDIEMGPTMGVKRRIVLRVRSGHVSSLYVWCYGEIRSFICGVCTVWSLEFNRSWGTGLLTPMAMQ